MAPGNHDLDVDATQGGRPDLGVHADLGVHDREFGREMEAMFEKDRARCEEITYKKWKRRGLTKRLSEFVFFWFEEYY